MADLPNVVLICVDAWRYDALEASPDRHWLERYGLASKLHTPNLNRFSSESVYFDHALATAPHTTPSHASILTGLFPAQHGVRSFLFERLPGEVETLPEMLRRHGYSCFSLREVPDPRRPGILQKAEVLRGFSMVYELQDLVSRVRHSVEQGRPILAYLHLWDIHAPYLFSPAARKRGQIAPYLEFAAALSRQTGICAPDPGRLTEQVAMDFQQRAAGAIGDVEQRISALFGWYIEGVSWFDEHRWPRIEAALRQAGLWDGSVILLFGDHGEGIHPDGAGASAFGHGQSLLDDVLRVPLLVRGLAGRGPQRIDEQVSLVDLAPTVLEVAGLPARPYLPGRSLAGLSSPDSSTQAKTAEDSPVHYAELGRGGAAFSLPSASKQALHQACARGEGYKVLAHWVPILMERYRRPGDRCQQWFSKMRAHAPGKKSEDAFKPAFGRWYWTDLQIDPDEERPHAWSGSAPDAAQALRIGLEKLIDEGTRGPEIELSLLEERAVLERLSALGYATLSESVGRAESSPESWGNGLEQAGESPERGECKPYPASRGATNE